MPCEPQYSGNYGSVILTTGGRKNLLVHHTGILRLRLRMTTAQNMLTEHSGGAGAGARSGRKGQLAQADAGCIPDGVSQGCGGGADRGLTRAQGRFAGPSSSTTSTAGDSVKVMTG